MEEYKFDGSAIEFLAIMKTCMVARQMQKEKRKDLYKVLSEFHKVEEVAEEYGMDDYVLIKELIRLTDELENTEFYRRKYIIEGLLQFVEERNEKESNEENGI